MIDLIGLGLTFWFLFWVLPRWIKPWGRLVDALKWRIHSEVTGTVDELVDMLKDKK